MTRLQLMTIHALLAAFIFPVATMFMLTGALYTWGIKGSYQEESYKIQLATEMNPDLNELIELTEAELKKRELSYPSGKAKLKNYGNHFMLEWTGSSKDVILEPTDNKLTAKLTVKHTSWYRNLVQLHKAKGGTAFKVYAAVFAIAIGLLLISGLFLAWQSPKLKQLTLLTFFIGIGSFIVIVGLS